MAFTCFLFWCIAFGGGEEKSESIESQFNHDPAHSENQANDNKLRVRICSTYILTGTYDSFVSVCSSFQFGALWSINESGLLNGNQNQFESKEKVTFSIAWFIHRFQYLCLKSLPLRYVHVYNSCSSYNPMEKRRQQ